MWTLNKNGSTPKRGSDKAQITLLPFAQLTTEIAPSEILMPLSELCLAICSVTVSAYIPSSVLPPAGDSVN